ncbi:uncharacterized protein LOC142236924 [Haematobia irritans]|uniref:uncharacterized protein LOC142236924 n=1 Tax=Haematobia irritans TaxID=7368 RepID=UPI003F50CF34
MNLVIVSVLLLAMLAFQPTLIYGSKNLAPTSGNGNSARRLKSPKYGKRHRTDIEQPLYSPALSASSKLVLSLESGDVLVRAARGASVDKQQQNPTPTVVTNNNGKRQKGNGNNKKLNKNSATRENGGSAMPLGGTGGRKHLEKKFSASSGLSHGAQLQQQQQQQQPGNGNKSSKRQMLKSQSHQGKRSGNKGIRDGDEMSSGASAKTTSTCRYSKSVWSECDAKTNTRSRTLSLKKGDASCQQTRTMEKKCKKPCRYEKGAWSECINGQMTREDKLKATGGTESTSSSSSSPSSLLSSSCEPIRSISKKCNPNNGAASSKQANGNKRERKNKDKGSRRNLGQHNKQPQHQQ